KTFFGSLSPSALRNYMANTSSLKSNIESELNKQRQLVQLLSPNPNSAFEFLKDLSSSVPKDVVTDLMRYQVGASAQEPYSSPGVLQPPVELEFWVPSPDVAETLAMIVAPKRRGFENSPVD